MRLLAIGVLAIATSICMRDFDKYLTNHVSRQGGMPTMTLSRRQRVQMVLGRTRKRWSRQLGRAMARRVFDRQKDQ